MANIMVCVTQQKTCDRLIEKGRRLLEESGEGELFIVNVTKEDKSILYNSDNGEALEYLFDKARENNAFLTVVKSDNILRTLVEFVEMKNINYIVAGTPGQKKNVPGMLNNLKKKTKGRAELIVVPE